MTRLLSLSDLSDTCLSIVLFSNPGLNGQFSLILMELKAVADDANII